MSNKWISIKDRLPEPMTDILIYGECICGHVGCDDIGKTQVWCGYKQGSNDEFLTLESRCTIKAEYWMPLPEKPEDLKKE